MNKSAPNLEDLELIEVFSVRCPMRGMHHKDAMQYTLRVKKDLGGNCITSWFFCGHCSPPGWAPPKDKVQAFHWWLTKSRKKNNKQLILGSAEAYELLKQTGQCLDCGDKAIIMKLQPKGGRIVSSWLLCDHCSPPYFYLPETAQEAYDRWQKKLQRKANTEVVDSFTPDRS